MNTKSVKWIHCHCKNGHAWNIDAEAPRTQVTCNYPKFERTDDYASERGITVGGTFVIFCPTCGEVGEESKRHFTGTLSGIRCSHACQEAEGGNCKCSCGGQYHGIEAR